MKYFVLCFIMLLIIVSCYQYVEYKREPTCDAIYVPVIKPADLLDTSIVTKGETLKASISVSEPTVSQAITNSLIRYLRIKGINVARVSSKTIYRILSEIPRRSFISRNRNMVYVGETFAYRLPKAIYIKIITDSYYLIRGRVFGRENLVRTLSFKWLKSYELNVFDCSEESAFLEFWLERNGFNTDMVIDSMHGWLIVEEEPGNWVNVEATGYSPSFIPKRKYRHRFKDIYEEISYFPKECDWWEEIKPGEGVIGRYILK